jgi:hypothetical protein
MGQVTWTELALIDNEISKKQRFISSATSHNGLVALFLSSSLAG